MATLGVSELINQTFHNSNNSQLTAVTVGQLGQLDSVTIGQWARQCLIVNTCKMQMSRVESTLKSRLSTRTRVRAPFHCAIYHNLDAYIANEYSKYSMFVFVYWQI